MEKYAPGDELELLVSRRERILRIPLTAGEEPAETWQLEIDPDAPKKTQKRRTHWLAPIRAATVMEQ